MQGGALGVKGEEVASSVSKGVIEFPGLIGHILEKLIEIFVGVLRHSDGRKVGPKLRLAEDAVVIDFVRDLEHLSSVALLGKGQFFHQIGGNKSGKFQSQVAFWLFLRNFTYRFHAEAVECVEVLIFGFAQAFDNVATDASDVLLLERIHVADKVVEGYASCED